MQFNGEEMDNFDDELPEGESSPEAEPEIIDREDRDGDDNNESTPYERIAEILRADDVNEEVSETLATLPQGSALFQRYEQSNYAYASAITAYYEEKNYQQAIEKFDEAIANASERAANDLTEEQANEIVAKSMYWQAEAYVKTENIPQAIEIFEALIQNCKGHYLTLAAKRRTDELNTK